MSLSNFVINFPTKIVFGPGELANLGIHAKSLGTRAFLIADPYWATTGLTDRTAQILEAQGIKTIIFAEATPNPECSDVDSAARLVREANSQFVLGLGGGSAIDMAKAIAVAATHEGSIEGYVNWNPQPKPVTAATLPIVAIPTTAGTGAEVTQAAVMADPVNNRKTAIFNDNLFPRLAVVDPELSASMPPTLTAATGLDALSHAIEGILNTQRRNPFADMVALEAVALVNTYLPRACADGKDLEARTWMAWAALLGGVSIAQSGTTVPHALGQPLGVRRDVHHGLSIATFLPAILAKSWQADPPLFARIATALGVPESLSVGARARSVAGAVRNLIATVGLDKEIAKISIDQTTADSIVQDATSYLGKLIDRHIQPLTQADLREIVKESVTVR